MTYEKENLKKFENETGTSINELTSQIKELQTNLNNLDVDSINGLAYSLELIDPEQKYFNDDISQLFKLGELLRTLEFNQGDYIISKLENEYNK